MIEFRELTILILFALRTTQIVLFQTKLLQVKEYRLDRILVHLKENFLRLGFFSNLIQSIVLLFVGWLFGGQVFVVLTFIVITIYSLSFLYSIYKRCVARPKFTVRAKLMLVISFGLFIILYLLLFQFDIHKILNASQKSLFEAYIIIQALSVIISMISLLITFIPSNIFWKRKIKRAALKFKTLKNIKIIGITGSYGKSSVKNMLCFVLASKFRVVATFENNNTLIGIADLILRKASPKTELLVLEMGAYKRGEIAAIANLFKPEIAILTGINDQHSKLFGGITNTMKAKFELVQSLELTGKAIFNADDKNVLEVMKNSKVKKIPYSVKKDLTNLSAKVSSRGTIYSFNLEGKTYKVSTKLFGEFNINNILAVAKCAKLFGIEYRETFKIIEKYKPNSKTLRVYNSKSKKELIVDNSYNSNPDGFKSSVQTLLSLSKNKKAIIITPGFIELDNKKTHYENILKIIGKRELIIYASDFRVWNRIHCRRNIIIRPLKSFKISAISQETVILIEGRVKQDIYESIKNA